MSDTERVIGELKEFKRVALKEMDNLRDDLREVKKEVRMLMRFKWRVAGGSAVLMTVLTAVVEAIHVWKGPN